MIEVGPCGVARKRSEVRAVAHAVDILCSEIGMTEREVCLGTEQKHLGKADERHIHTRCRPVAVRAYIFLRCILVFERIHVLVDHKARLNV